MVSYKRFAASFLFVVVSVLFTELSGAACSDGKSEEDRGPHLPAGLDRPAITDQRVVQVMSNIRRADFVPFPLKPFANADRPLPIGKGQTISQPFIVAYMSQEARVRSGDKVLEIGTGNGYQTAVLAKLGAKVFSIEIVPELGNAARKRLKELGYQDVNVRVGDGYQGWPSEAPFQAIVVTAAAPRIPAPLFAQLADNGRMVIPLADQAGNEWMSVVTKDEDGKPVINRAFPVRFVPMTGEVNKED